MVSPLPVGRPDGLSDESRAGRPRTIGDDQVVRIIGRMFKTTPPDATHWSIRPMAGESSLSHTTVRRIRTAFGLQPHRSGTFKALRRPGVRG